MFTNGRLDMSLQSSPYSPLISVHQRESFYVFWAWGRNQQVLLKGL